MSGNSDSCQFCGLHRLSFRDWDEACDESPSGYHRTERVQTWRDRQIRFGHNVVTLDEWAALVFVREGEGVASFKSVPIGMRRALVRLWSCYPSMPGGLADPMYVANVIASEMGFGDGHGNFEGVPK